jgi:hypothetical protein
MSQRELCVSCIRKYIFALPTRINSLSIVLATGKNLYPFVEKIDLESEIKIKLAISRLLEKTGLIKEYRIAYEHPREKGL